MWRLYAIFSTSTQRQRRIAFILVLASLAALWFVNYAPSSLIAGGRANQERSPQSNEPVTPLSNIKAMLESDPELKEKLDKLLEKVGLEKSGA